jgi:ABC-2 type transport system ATP-binding protein
LLQITSGSITVFGYELPREAGEVRKIISYLPEEAGAYKNLTGKEYLNFIARFFGEGEKLPEYGPEGIGNSQFGRENK